MASNDRWGWLATFKDCKGDKHKDPVENVVSIRVPTQALLTEPHRKSRADSMGLFSHRPNDTLHMAGQPEISFRPSPDSLIFFLYPSLCVSLCVSVCQFLCLLVCTSVCLFPPFSMAILISLSPLPPNLNELHTNYRSLLCLWYVVKMT